MPLWIGMIVLGTFIRGPNWNMFGIYEYWDVHKLEVLNNVDLSKIFWVDWMGQPLPSLVRKTAALMGAGKILMREWLGLVLVPLHLVALPPLLAATFFRLLPQDGFHLGFMVLANLLLFHGVIAAEDGRCVGPSTQRRRSPFPNGSLISNRRIEPAWANSSRTTARAARLVPLANIKTSRSG
ncbi:MAG: hypothetical protein R3B90_10505 [Planctomycetaceae bacterium]